MRKKKLRLSKTKFIYLPQYHFIKGFEEIFTDFGMEVELKTKHTLKKVSQSPKDQTESFDKPNQRD